MQRILWLSLLAAAAISQAATLPYQGILTDASSNPVKDGNSSLVLNLYGTSDGSATLWTESQTATTKKGLFSIRLGSVSPIPDSLFARDSLFLGLSVAGGAELTPRTRLGASPWAIRALRADTATYARNAAGTGSSFDTAALTARLGKKVDTAVLTTKLSAFAAASDLNVLTTLVGTKATATDLGLTRDTLKIARDSIAKLTARVANLEASVASLTTANTMNAIDIANIVALLKGVTRTGDELYFDSLNVNIRNGKGSTSTTNGLGNLVVGYNEKRGVGDDRSGSHAVVLGSKQNWSSYGNLVAGYRNTTSGSYASVTGGSSNLASGNNASVAGGSNDTATGLGSSIIGGGNNKATGPAATVTGGYGNNSSATSSLAAGGNGNTADGNQSGVFGGQANIASANFASILGGQSNSITFTRGTGGFCSTIVGGSSNVSNSNYTTHTGATSLTASSDNQWLHP